MLVRVQVPLRVQKQSESESESECEKKSPALRGDEVPQSGSNRELSLVLPFVGVMITSAELPPFLSNISIFAVTKKPLPCISIPIFPFIGNLVKIRYCQLVYITVSSNNLPLEDHKLLFIFRKY
jgi:hypothetical protein